MDKGPSAAVLSFFCDSYFIVSSASNSTISEINAIATSVFSPSFWSAAAWVRGRGLCW